MSSVNIVKSDLINYELKIQNVFCENVGSVSCEYVVAVGIDPPFLTLGMSFEG